VSNFPNQSSLPIKPRPTRTNSSTAPGHPLGASARKVSRYMLYFSRTQQSKQCILKGVGRSSNPGSKSKAVAPMFSKVSGSLTRLLQWPSSPSDDRSSRSCQVIGVTSAVRRHPVNSSEGLASILGCVSGPDILGPSLLESISPSCTLWM
jgi:hypothetical protein